MPINIKLDTAALLQWGKRQSQLPKEIRQATARSLNKVGRHALDTVVDRLSQESGLSPATVRRRFTLDLASENNLVFAINANQEIEINKSSRPMPGRSFAKRPDSYFREGELVNIVTMGDDRVCPLCEALAEGSPYTIEEARAQIPHHRNCRCVVEPASTGPGKVVADKFRPAVPEVMPGGEVTLQELTTALADEVRVIFKAV
jgi:hypothetical protein